MIIPFLILFSAVLVFLMGLGFGCMEAGLIRSKNATNVLFKIMVIPVISLLSFYLWGFNLLYPGMDYAGGFAGFSGFLLDGDPSDADFYSFFIYQTLIASIAACIISGALAERIKFSAFIIFCFFFLGIIYPIVGMWHWGGGWLNEEGPIYNLFNREFHDFSGATMVHAVGGWAALIGAIMIGPRNGKYVGGKIVPIPGHNMTLAVIGIFLIWIGWFGFNCGVAILNDLNTVPYILLNTSISAAAGCFAAFTISFLIYKIHDITMSINGILAGLVSISASVDVMSPLEALVIGSIAGLLVVFSVLLFDSLKIDDPMGAISVHLMCGAWGTVAVGIFGSLGSKEQFLTQIIGFLAIGITVSILSFIGFFLIKKFKGLRCTYKEELEGLDFSEHGMRSYNLDS